MSANIVFHLAATVAYAVLGLWFWLQTAKGQSQAKLDVPSRAAFAGVIAIHIAAVTSSIFPNGHLYLGWAIALSAAICLGMILFWFQSMHIRSEGLLLILLPAGSFVSLLASVFPYGHIVNHANNELLRIHLIIAFLAYGITAIAAMHAILMAMLDKHLHRPIAEAHKRTLLDQALDSMPALLVQERLLFQLIKIGFAVLTLTVFTGAMVSMRISHTLAPIDHKTVFTLLSWCTFGVLLWGRNKQGWRGRIALRWTLAGFAFVLLAYTGSRFVLDVLISNSSELM